MDFVPRNKKRFSGAAQKASQFFVQGSDPGLPVDNEQKQRGLVDGHMSLPQNLLRDERLIVGDDAAGVDNLKRVAAPIRFAIDTIAGDARLVGHDGASRAGEAIEKCGLADIWAAHNHQRCWSLGHGCEQWSMARNRSDDAILDCIAFAAKPTVDHRVHRVTEAVQFATRRYERHDCPRGNAMQLTPSFSATVTISNTSD